MGKLYVYLYYIYKIFIIIYNYYFSGGYIMIYNHKEQIEPIIIDFVNNTIEGIYIYIRKYKYFKMHIKFYII